MSATERHVPIDSAQRGRGPFIWRFNLYHRLTHAVVVFSFFLLVITGMPLKMHCAPWAAPLVSLLGGVEMAGILHRFGAIMTFGYFTAHLGFLFVRFIRSDDKKGMFWGHGSMVPQPKDVKDFIAQVKWFLGKGPRPHFGRYSYMEKFDYLAVFWGMFIIGGSGVLLWFPEFFAGFLPGWAFNLAAVVHADEAILATAFIFTIHFFNVHMRPEKFPLDAVIMTGRATMEYMEEEHPMVVEDLGGEPKPYSERPVLDAAAPPPTRRATTWAAVFGFITLGLGFALIGMMLWVAFC